MAIRLRVDPQREKLVKDLSILKAVEARTALKFDRDHKYIVSEAFISPRDTRFLRVHGFRAQYFPGCFHPFLVDVVPGKKRKWKKPFDWRSYLLPEEESHILDHYPDGLQSTCEACMKIKHQLENMEVEVCESPI